MKLNPNVHPSELLSYGFTKPNKEEEERKDNYTVAAADYVYEIGHSRRGQHYYILFYGVTNSFSLYSSEPDGDGGTVPIPDVLITLIEKQIVIR